MMSRKWVLWGCLFALSLTAAASVTDPNIISAVARLNSAVAIEPNLASGLAEAAFPFADRINVTTPLRFGAVEGLTGLDYVQTCMDDKADADVQYNVTLNKAGTLYLIIDNRVGEGTTPDLTTPPTLGTVMPWVATMGFTQTAYTVLVNNTASTVYALPVAGPGTISLGAQNDGTSRNMYVIAAAPAGWNLAPAIHDVAATAAITWPATTLDVNGTILDDGVPGTGVSVQWTTTAQPAGSTVEYAPTNATEDVTITFSSLGTYTLQIEANDGEKSSQKTLTVKVKLPEFALQATDFCEVGNDSNQQPTAARKATILDVKNHNDGTNQRRRVGYCRYDISAIKATLEQEGKVFANSFISANADKGTALTSANAYVYAIKEELDGFTLNGTKWNNAPGVVNNPLPALNSAITLATLDLADIYPLLLSFQCPATDTWYSSAISSSLDEVLNSDKDGSVVLMFICYDPESKGFEFYSPTNSAALATEPETNKKGLILRGNMVTPTWAHAPKPANFSITSSSLTTLSWTNPAAVETITCDVYFGTDPDTAAAHYGLTKIADGISGSSVAVPYALTQYEDYYWIVDVHDSGNTPDLAAGNLWMFNTSNAPPSVNAGDDQYKWLGNAGDPTKASVTLNAAVQDDHLPSDTLTYKWTQTGGTTVIDANSIIIATQQPATTEDISLVLPQTGSYTFVLAVSDGAAEVSDTTVVRVANTPCQAAHLKTGYTKLAGDLNDDCYVDQQDLEIFITNWLECTSLAPCF